MKATASKTGNAQSSSDRWAKNADNFFVKVAGFALFLVRFFRTSFFPPYEFRETFRQAYKIGRQSFLLVNVTGFIIGLVFILQSWPTLMEFGATSYVPALASTSIIRELGPLITAFVCAGNIASSMSAELGSMKVTEQIDSMEVAGINPFKYLAVTRIWAATLMIPVLVIYADTVGLVGAYVGANIKGTLSFSLFMSQVWDTLTFNDVIPAFLKTFLFGFTIGIVGCHQGFATDKGTAGVGNAANIAVVSALFLVIILDMVSAQVGSIFEIL